jgi:hypothetical protein
MTVAPNMAVTFVPETDAVSSVRVHANDGFDFAKALKICEAVNFVQREVDSMIKN